jgi:hypothetical protein
MVRVEYLPFVSRVVKNKPENFNSSLSTFSTSTIEIIVSRKFVLHNCFLASSRKKLKFFF